MWNKPFKPPLLKIVHPAPPVERVELTPPRPSKKPRLVHHLDDLTNETASFPSEFAASNAKRRPLTSVVNSLAAVKASDVPISGPESYWLVLWRKFTAKKHKTWDGDGVLVVRDGYAHLQDISGREMGKCTFNGALALGSLLSVGGKDVEIDAQITREDYMAGRPFLNTGPKRTPSLEETTNKSVTKKAQSIYVEAVMSSTGGHKARMEKDQRSVGTVTPKSFYASAPKDNAAKARFKTPLLVTSIMPQDISGAPTPRHNPNSPGALVMKRPKYCPNGKGIVDVVVDPLLADKLRPHQREGVKFLYECVMGMRPFNGQGALLADDMGLGKTLQTITLLWTLLKQNPIHGSGPVIKKALVVCPVTLMDNWKKEFKRWLGNHNIGVLLADGQTRLTDFTHGKSYSVMIIGYEKLRNVQEELKKGGGIDIVIADEGHRMKTAQNKCAQAIRNLDATRRIVLTGTPMQNDLSEFYTMVDFVNPGLIGTYNTFKKEFEIPILKSRQPGALKKDKEKGEAREEELASLTKDFILRRDAEVQAKFLPPKTEYVLFCKPTTAQAEAYQYILESPCFGSVAGNTGEALPLITLLKKVCNAPSLLNTMDDKADASSEGAIKLVDNIPTSILKMSYLVSGTKFRVLDSMLKLLSTTTKEKIVLVSHYTTTLNLLAQHLSSLSLPFLRLDGSTPVARRQDLVDEFNGTESSKNFAFLLSAKAGGAGINLVGASRLVLFDVDWNPATDLQAMARIHRPGQKRSVKIYRFLMAGGMDEKIYQRQITKMGLADSVIDGKKNEASFSPEELKDLFRLDLNSGCQTHDLLGCDCKGMPPDPNIKSSTPEPVGILNSDKEEEQSESDEEFHFPANPTLISASQYDWRASEQKIADDAKKKRKEQGEKHMQALMKFAHIDTSVFTGERTDVFGFEKPDVEEARKILEDKILVDLLEKEHCKVSFIFAKRSKTE